MNKLLLFSLLCCSASAQTASQSEPVDSHAIIRSETRLVLVDSVVTDKKGNYVHDLTQKDFKVFEDNKEQQVTSFSFETGANPDTSRKHYLVLFFDNSSVNPSQQTYARDAATKFIEKNAGPNRLMAIVEFGGTLKVSQNFTDDADRLKKVVAGVKFSSVGSAAGPGLGRGFTNFSTRGVLGALRDMAKGLADVPGRKTLVFLSGGFPLTAELETELTATIDACNRANVAVYPIDIRGLVAPTIGGFVGGLTSPARLAQMAMLNAASLTGPVALWQGRGGSSSGGGSTGGSTGGGNAGGGKTPGTGGSPGGSGSLGSHPVTGPTTGSSGGGRSGNTGNIGGGGAAPNPNNNPLGQANRTNRMNSVLPPFDPKIGGNQQMLYALANGTGGFVIVNTNDLLGGLDKIGREQNEYYLLGYTPSKEAEPGACHTLKVKVDKGGTEVRSRSGYCEAKTVDVLSGTPAERDLEARMSGTAPSTIPAAAMLVSYFYTSPGIARVDVALDLPAGAIKLVKEKGKFQAVMNVVGIAYLADGGVGARFSDSVKFGFEEKKQAEEFEAKPYHYEKQFETAPAKYNFKVVFSSNATQFGKLESPLVVDSWDGTKFALSGLALSREVHPAAQMLGALDQDLLENRVPLVVNGVQMTPTGTNRFHKGEPPALGLDVRLFDPKTGELKKDFGLSPLKHNGQLGNPAVPVGLVLDLQDVAPGTYTLAVTAVDAANHQVSKLVPLEVEN